MREALTVPSRCPSSVASNINGRSHMKRKLVVLVVAAALMLVGATLAFGGPGRLVYDDGAYVKPGSLDDGKELRPQASITLPQAIAAAQNAASGSLGQVDLERFQSRLVYTVDVGDHEVKVDAASGRIDGVVPRD
jgi:hypothetical protein